MNETIAIISLVSGRCSLLRGSYDRQPLIVQVRDPARLLCPIELQAGGETILTLDRADARKLAAALESAARKCAP